MPLSSEQSQVGKSRTASQELSASPFNALLNAWQNPYQDEAIIFMHGALITVM